MTKILTALTFAIALGFSMASASADGEGRSTDHLPIPNEVGQAR